MSFLSILQGWMAWIFDKDDQVCEWSIITTEEFENYIGFCTKE